MTAVNSCRCPRHAFGGLHSSANNRRDHDSSVSTRSDRRRSERNNLVVAAVAKAAIAIAHAESSQSRRMIGTSQTASRDVLRMGAWPSALLLSRRTRRIDARGRAFWPGGFSCSKLFTVVHVLSSVTKMAHCTNQDVVTLSILLLRVRRFTQSEPPLESSIEPQIVSMEGFNERTTASVPIQDCLNRGVHPIELCPVLCPPPNATDCDQVHGHRLKALLGNASGALHHNS